VCRYRVARVEQTETPEMLKERNDVSGKKKDKVVRRELCSVLSKGTRTYCHLDDLSLFDNPETSQQASESLLVCILERCFNSEDGEEVIEYGVCCVDTVLGNITLGQYQDDAQRCRLRAFLLRYPPSEVLLHEDSAASSSSAVMNIIRLIAPKALVTTIRRSEFPSPTTTLNMIQTSRYFQHEMSQDIASSSESAIMNYPEVLEAASQGITSGSSDLLVSALGGCIWQMKRSLIDYEIVSMRKILAYIPPDEEQVLNAALEEAVKSSFHPTTESATADISNSIRHMTIDAVALANLEILVNNYDRSERGSLYAFLNRCRTSFGKRLLKEWLCHPLYQPSDIKQRADAVEEFLINSSLSNPELIKQYESIVQQIPDLERLLSRVHSTGLINKSGSYQDHPDQRAVMYESQTYNLRKIKDFADILSGFESCVKIGKLMQQAASQHPIQSELFKKITRSIAQGGKFPYDEMDRILRYFRDIFDEKQAKKDGYIRPKAGVNEAYDQAKAQVEAIESDFEAYLKEMKKELNLSDIKYFGTNKDRYQLEIPMAMVSKVPSSWTTKSQKKTHRRYWTSWIEKKLEQLTAAEDRLVIAQNDTNRKIFAKFDEKSGLWSDAVTCMATLDALYSLAEVSKTPGYVRAVVESRELEEGAYIRIEQGRHPMLEHAMALR
jgi:DNA mismatch repair protein MSH6